MKSITIPSTVTKICGAAFAGCKGLTTITLPDNVTEVYGKVFMNCINLKTIYLGPNIKGIPDGIFENCKNLTDIYLKATKCPFTPLYAFDRNVPCDRITLHVPNDVVDMYKGMIPWNKFNIVGM